MAVLYSARFDTADLAQVARSEILSCRVYRAGALVAPTQAGSTVTIYDENGEAVVTAGAVTVTDSIATYTLLGTVTDDYDPSAQWRIVWSLVISTITYTFDNRLILCRRVPFPVLTEAGIYARVPALDPTGHAPISRRTEYSVTIDDAWIRLTNRLVESGRRIELITDPSVLRECHLLLVLAQVFDDLAARLNESHGIAAAAFRAQYEAAWGSLVLPTDTDDNDGRPDVEQVARGPVWAM